MDQNGAPGLSHPSFSLNVWWLFLLPSVKWGSVWWEQHPEKPSSAGDAWHHLMSLPMDEVKFSVNCYHDVNQSSPLSKSGQQKPCRVGYGEQKVHDIGRDKWPQGRRGAAKGLAPLQGQETPLTLSDQCDVDLNKLFFSNTGNNPSWLVLGLLKMLSAFSQMEQIICY